MKLFMRYLSLHLKSQLSYKKSFFMLLFAQFLGTGITFLGLFFMMDRFKMVEGHKLPEVMMSFGVTFMAFSLAETVFRGLDHFSATLSQGGYDRILLRPQNDILQAVGSLIDFTRLGRALQGMLILSGALAVSGIHWSAAKLAVLVMMIIGGIVLFSSLFLLYAGVCFFTTQGLEVMNILTDGGREFGSYPMDIYGQGILRFFTFVVPMSLFQTYPAAFLFDRGPSWWGILPVGCGLFILPAYAVWAGGRRKFNSTGS